MTIPVGNTWFGKNGIMGLCMIIGGSIFLFLSFVKNMNDEEISRAVSIQKKSVADAAVGVARNNQGAIKQAAWDNKEVIGQVAYDNRDVIG